MAAHLPAFAAMLVLFACGASDPSSGDFTYGPPPPGAPAMPTTVSSSTAGTIVASGTLRTPCEPYAARASVDRADGHLLLTITGDATGPCPADVVGALVYRYVVRDIPPGMYAIVLRHEYADANWPTETVREASITVP